MDAVADLRAQVGATAPLHKGKLSLAPPFGEKCAPRRDPKTHFLPVRSECGANMQIIT